MPEALSPVIERPKPATPETPKQQRQQKEIRQVSDVILKRKIDQTAQEVAQEQQNNPGGFQAYLENPANRGKQALMTYDILHSANETQGAVGLFANEALEITTKTGVIKITGVKARNGDQLACDVEGQADPVAVDRRAVLEAYLGVEGDAILKQFSQENPERALLEAQIKQIRGDKFPADDAPESASLDTTIQKAAESQAMPTTEIVRSFITKATTPEAGMSAKQQTELT